MQTKEVELNVGRWIVGYIFNDHTPPIYATLTGTENSSASVLFRKNLVEAKETGFIMVEHDLYIATYRIKELIVKKDKHIINVTIRDAFSDTNW